MKRVFLVFLLAIPACRGAGGAEALDIALNVALAASVAAANRANGDCYVPCSFGTYCDEQTGSCEALPCHGSCGADEYCDQSNGTEQCLPGATLEVAQPPGPPPSGAIELPPAPTPPLDVPAAQPDLTHAHGPTP